MSCRRNRFRKQITEAKEGPLELRRERQGKGTQAEGWGKVLRAPSVLGPLSCGYFFGGLRGWSQQNIHTLSTCVLSGSWSALIGQHQGRGSLINAAGPDVTRGVACLFCCFSGPGAETHLRPGCIWWRSEPHCPGGLMLKSYSPGPLFVPPPRGSNLCDEQYARGGSKLHEQGYKRSGV